jgi:hypothetical protein
LEVLSISGTDDTFKKRLYKEYTLLGAGPPDRLEDRSKNCEVGPMLPVHGYNTYHTKMSCLA